MRVQNQMQIPRVMAAGLVIASALLPSHRRLPAIEKTCTDLKKDIAIAARGKPLPAWVREGVTTTGREVRSSSQDRIPRREKARDRRTVQTGSDCQSLRGTLVAEKCPSGKSRDEPPPNRASNAEPNVGATVPKDAS